MENELVERVARRIYERRSTNLDVPDFANIPHWAKLDFYEDARAAIAAMRERPRR